MAHFRTPNYNFVEYWPIFQLFHYQNQEKICITKDPTAPQLCRYITLWNVSVLKATTENSSYDQMAFYKYAYYYIIIKVRRPAARRTHWTFDVKLQDVTVSLDNNWDKKHAVCC